MALSPEVLQALAKELSRLGDEQLRVTQEMHEIEALLRRHGRKIGPVPEGPSPARESRSPTTAIENTGEDISSLRQTILRIMDQANRGYRPSEVTNALMFRGFTDTGTGAATPFAGRVASEMARLFREGRLTKDPGDGRYRSQVHANGNGRGPGEPSALDTLMKK